MTSCGLRDEMYPADKKKQKTVLCPAKSQQSINTKGKHDKLITELDWRADPALCVFFFFQNRNTSLLFKHSASYSQCALHMVKQYINHL